MRRTLFSAVARRGRGSAGSKAPERKPRAVAAAAARFLYAACTRRRLSAARVMLPLAELFLLALLTLTHDVYFFLSTALSLSVFYFFLSFSFCSRSRRRRTSPVAARAWRNASPLEASSPRICPMLYLGSSVPHFGTYTGASTNQECKRSASTCVCWPPYSHAPSCTELLRPSVYVRGGQCTVPHASPATYTAAASGVASRQTT